MSTIGFRRPVFAEVILGTSSNPWTRDAFILFLSRHHCMENLEFSVDVEKYIDIYTKSTTNIPMSSTKRYSISSSWERLMQSYIEPGAPREVNVSGRIRDNLLNLPYILSPPKPSELYEAQRLVSALVDDSLAIFLESAGSSQPKTPIINRDTEFGNTSMPMGGRVWKSMTGILCFTRK
ncbi:hypothetical protein BKA67DRAFT_566160 [Truncatella angustata]|uniref:RGS domain-containing protein n=1 Tax=Truncatella angustata TaxID=152316 RepID=A0A9P8UMA5_9PEZI|nr:uncharacterized protein BKA67DRAFT_566160 [Truncatella angustata]KAH6654761.1 hypothetical protein BKA67DRAFT_566160 [Truncatella angustata]